MKQIYCKLEIDNGEQFTSPEAWRHFLLRLPGVKAALVWREANIMMTDDAGLGLHLLTIEHTHRHGTDSYLVFSEEQWPETEQLVRELEIDFEPDMDEEISIFLVHNIPIIRQEN